MIIADFMELCIDEMCETVQIFDCEQGDNIYRGLYDEMPYKYNALEIESWNSIEGGICFNVDLS